MRDRLEGIGFGFLVPVYFVVTGMTFDIDSLLTPRGSRSLRSSSRSCSSREARRRSSGFVSSARARPASLALFGATGLPLDRRDRRHRHRRVARSRTVVGASLIGAGMVSVLVYPLLAMRLAGRQEGGVRVGDAP